MNVKSFLKQCIAEVLVEPTKQPNRLLGKKMASLVKQCLAEVIVEPFPRKKKVYGNPRRLKATQLVKECIMEVLKESLLSEALDPTSQGPNIPQENPYPEMNNKMRMMETDAEKEDAWKRYERGYAHGEAHKRSGQKPKETMDNVESVGYHDAIMGKPKSTPEVVRKSIRETDPHGRYAQQAGATPFQSPGDTSIVEYDDQQATITKTKKEVFAALAADGFQHLGDEPRDHMEYYLNGFVTVSIYISYDDNSAHVERYYDSEMVDNIPGHHIDAKIPIPAKYDPAVSAKLIKLCKGLKKRSVGDESIFGGIDDIEEAKTQSTEVEWPCPHCGQTTVIPVEIESPSDYIACSDCEHCGKEISDPKLDQQVYDTVINYYAGKADYLKDTSLQEAKKKSLTESDVPISPSARANKIIKNLFGWSFIRVQEFEKNGKTYYVYSSCVSDPKCTRMLIHKDEEWELWDGRHPDEIRPVPPEHIPALPMPMPPPRPKPLKIPKTRIQFNLAQAVEDLACKSSGNQELDDRIKQVGLNPREAAAVCMNHLGYSNSQIGRLLKIRTSRVRTSLEVAWRLLRRQN